MGKRIIRKTIIAWGFVIVFSIPFIRTFATESKNTTDSNSSVWDGAETETPSGTGIAFNSASGRNEYMVKGKYNYGFTGVAKSLKDGLYYYVEKGVVTGQFTGIAYNKDNKRWEYFNNSKANYNYTGIGVSVYDNLRYYVEKGTVTFSFRGVAKDRTTNEWRYFSGSKENSRFIGAAKSVYDNLYYFVRNGKVDFSYTGYGYNPDTKTWYYFGGGKERPKFTGVATSTNNQYYYARNGQVDTSFTGVAYSKVHGTFLYFIGGRHRPDYSGPSISASSDMCHHVLNGKIANWYTGTYKKGRSEYKVYRGRVYDSYVTLEGKAVYVTPNSRIEGTRLINGRRYCYDETGKIVSKVGIDVSAWQENIDWKAVKEDGVDFAIVKVGGRYAYTGEIYQDKKALTNLANANKAQLKVGAYFYTQAINVKEAQEEAKFTVNTIKKYKIDMPVAIDTEWFEGGEEPGRHEGITVEQRTAVVKAYCEYIKKAGYKPMIYASTYWLNNYLNMTNLKDYTVWCAQYSDDVTYEGAYKIWQYGQGPVKGVTNGNVDLNILFEGK